MVDVSHILFGGGGGAYHLPVISQTTGPIAKIQTPFDSPARELSEQGIKLDLESLMTSQGMSNSIQTRNSQSQGRLFGLDDIADQKIVVKRKQSQ